MKALVTRYYSEEDPDQGITAAKLKRIPKERQWEYVRRWFHRMFEDPAVETPHPEGEYLYIWGGPYDALEQLQDEFPDIPFERLEEFSRRLERSGVVEWAPGRDHPDHQAAADEHAKEDDPEVILDGFIGTLEAGGKTAFGGEWETSSRAQLVQRLDRIEALLERLVPADQPVPGIGHNNPPPDEQDPEDIPEDQLPGQAKIVTGEIRAELQKAEPDALVVAKKSSWLNKALAVIGAAVGALGIGALQQTGKAVQAEVLGRHPELVAAAADLVESAVGWLQAVTPIVF